MLKILNTTTSVVVKVVKNLASFCAPLCTYFTLIIKSAKDVIKMVPSQRSARKKFLYYTQNCEGKEVKKKNAER